MKRLTPSPVASLESNTGNSKLHRSSHEADTLSEATPAHNAACSIRKLTAKGPVADRAPIEGDTHDPAVSRAACIRPVCLLVSAKHITVHRLVAILVGL